MKKLQTNSSNLDKNLITKYRCADVFALDQRELSCIPLKVKDTIGAGDAFLCYLVLQLLLGYL